MTLLDIVSESCQYIRALAYDDVLSEMMQMDEILGPTSPPDDYINTVLIPKIHDNVILLHNKYRDLLTPQPLNILIYRSSVHFWSELNHIKNSLITRHRIKDDRHFNDEMENFSEVCDVIQKIGLKVYKDLNIIQERRQEIEEVTAAIVYQPEGTYATTAREKGYWAAPLTTTQYIKPTYRKLYDTCSEILIDRDTLMAIADELDITIPQDYTNEQICQLLKNYTEL